MPLTLTDEEWAKIADELIGIKADFFPVTSAVIGCGPPQETAEQPNSGQEPIVRTEFEDRLRVIWDELHRIGEQSRMDRQEANLKIGFLHNDLESLTNQVVRQKEEIESHHKAVCHRMENIETRSGTIENKVKELEKQVSFLGLRIMVLEDYNDVVEE